MSASRIRGATVASEIEIASFERAHRIRLPLSYREFLRVHGGGTPEPNCFVDDLRGLCLFVATIFPLSDARMAEQRFPFPPPKQSGYVTAGTNGGGDCYLISLDTGGVSYWDHELHNVVIDSDEVTWLAPSLGALVEALVYPPGELPEQIDQIERLGSTGTMEELEDFARREGLEAKNEAGRTVGEEAARYGNLALVRRCLELGASIKNLLHFAASGRSLELVRFLLDSGAGINDQNDVGQTPLDRAIVREVYELLEKAGGIHAQRRKPPHLS